MSDQTPSPSPGEPASQPQPPEYGQPPPPQYGQPAPGQPYPAGGAPIAGYSAELSPADQRMWGMLAHLSGLLTSIIGLSFLGPLIVYLLYRERGDFVRRQAAEALNFQILLNIVVVASVILSVVTFGLALVLVIPLWIVLGVAALILMIVAAVKVNAGEDYRYPFNWRLVR